MIALPLVPDRSVRRHVLGNGLTLLVRRDSSADVVAIVTHVKAGYFDETDDVVGIAHVLEHMYFKGTARRGVGELSRETKAAGGHLNAGTIYDRTSYYTVLPAPSVFRGLDIQFDAYANSLIDAGELRRELEVIIQEAKRKADDAGAVAIETLYEVLHDRHRMRRWRIGHEDALRRFTRDEVVRFYRGFYRPSATILAVVGNVDPDAVVRAVEATYGALAGGAVERTPGPAEGTHGGFRYRELSGDVMQTRLALGWRTPGTLDPDTPALDLAAATLSTGRASRLYRAVRDRELAESVSAANYTPTEVGVFAVQTAGPPTSALDAARGIWDQLRDLREGGVERGELERVRRMLEARWIRGLETMEGQANYLAEWEALGDWRLGDQVLERLLTLGPEQVTEAARRRLEPHRAGLVAYRPAGSAVLAADAGEMLRRLGAPPRPRPLSPAPPDVVPAPPRRVPRPELVLEEAGVRVYRTAGGTPILVRPRPGVPLAHAAVLAPGGACDESPDRAGLTALLVRTAVQGTHRRPAALLAAEAELLGGSVGTTLGAEMFGWSMTVPSERLDGALELLADVAQRPAIPEPELETERALALAALARQRDDMYAEPLRLLMRAAFPGHPYGVPAMGLETSLPALGAEQVRAWHGDRVLRGAAVVCIAGSVEPDDAAALAARHCVELEWRERAEGAAPAWPDAPSLLVEEREKAQTAIALGFPSPARGDDARFAAHLLAAVASGLGGRFFEELRDRRSLAYTVSAFTVERRLAGVFASYIATAPGREGDARAGLLAEFARLRDAAVTDEELRRAREFLIGARAIRLQSGAAQLAEMADAWLLGGSLRELRDHDQQLRAASAATLAALAARCFDPVRVVEGVVRGRA